MPTEPTRTANVERQPAADRLSYAGLMVALVLMNVWFFSQALPYVR